MKTQIAGDLLAGSVAPLILRIAMPSMAAMLASSLCTLADALLLSRGSTPLSAAVSVSFSLLTLIQALGFTLGMGAGSFVSRSLGRGDKPSAYAAASTAFFAALALSVLLCVPGALFAAPLVRLLGSPEDYRIRLDKGIGSATMDGKALSGGSTLGSGQHSIDIDGGIGSIRIQFVS